MALAGFSPLAHGSLVVTLVPTSGSSGVLVNGNNVTINNVGDVVHFNVVGIVTGQDATPGNDGLQAAFGSIQADGNGLIGNFSSAGASTYNAVAPFNTTVQKGAVQDLNGDGGLDLGFKAGDASTNYVESRAGSVVPSTGNAISTSGGSSTFLIGTVDWTATSASASTVAHWVPRASINTVWNEDGSATNSNGTANYTGGTGSTITAAPEPGSLALLGLGGLGLLLRRRRAM